MSEGSVGRERAEKFRDAYQRLADEIGKVIVGHREVIDGVLTCLFVGGHVLLEGVPGLGKTLLVRTLSDALALDFNRIQFTPDLMPSDVMGTNIITESPEGGRAFSFQRGPLFAQIVLADEITHVRMGSKWLTKLTEGDPERRRRAIEFQESIDERFNLGGVRQDGDHEQVLISIATEARQLGGFTDEEIQRLIKTTQRSQVY